MNVAAYVLGVSVVMLSAVSYAFAGTVAPEIDPGSIAAGLGLLAGGLLIARARWRSK
jgi:drug/metabolite transporter (DMT)-like permease